MKIHQNGPGSFVFHCPGCDYAHYFNSTWAFDGNFARPTISPSLLATGERRCHSFVRDGRIEFLADSDHALAGKTVELPEWPE